MAVHRNYIDYLLEDPKQTPYSWKERGHAILPEEKWTEWDGAVDADQKNLCQEGIIPNSLEAMEALENGTPYPEVKDIVDAYDHTGFSHSLVEAIIYHFAKNGPDFVDWAWPDKDNYRFTIRLARESPRF